MLVPESEGHNLSWHNVDTEFNEFVHAQMRDTGAILFGKRTYDLMAAFWRAPKGKQVDKKTAAAMDALPKYVANETPYHAAWANTKILTGNVVGEVAKLKHEPGNDIAILGSNMLCVSLMERRLVDEFRLMFNPVALGVGAPRRARRIKGNKATAKQSPCSSFVYKESASKERLRVSNWIVQGLYNYAVKKTVEL